MSLGVILCLVLGIVLHDVSALEIQPRIVNGYSSQVSDMKHIVNLRRNGAFICGGSLIKDDWVITAAHCVEGHSASQFRVYGGQTYRSWGGISRGVSTIFYSSKYNKKSVTWDIALLRLSGPMKDANIAPIPLCDAQLPVGTTVKVSGWGRTSEDGNASNALLSYDTKIISRTRCQYSYWGHPITATMMCAVSENSQDACSGDSGGPLIHKNQLHGIVSWGVGCARPNYPGVFTDVCSPEIKKYIEYTLNKYGK